MKLTDKRDIAKEMCAKTMKMILITVKFNTNYQNQNNVILNLNYKNRNDVILNYISYKDWYSLN